ncbi:MAG: SRPBCC family protein [Saccharofermentanales bacterium]
MQNNKSEDVKELVFNRVYDAPRDLVWKAWTDSGSISSWWGPNGFTTPVAEIDLRAGGSYRYCMRGPDGSDYWSAGVIREIVVPERLVMTDSFADPEGNIVNASYYGMNPDFPMMSIVTILFDEIDGKTVFTLKYEDVSSIPEEDLRNMTQGWNEMLDKLAAYLSADR